MQLLSVSVQAKKDDDWESLRSFPPTDRETASTLYRSITSSMGYSAKKLVGEYVKENGVMAEKTLSVKVFDGGKDVTKDEQGAKPAPSAPSPPARATPMKGRASGGGKASKKANGKAAKANAAPSAAAGAEQEDLVSFIGAFGKRLISALFNPGPPKAPQPKPVPHVPADVTMRHQSLQQQQGLYTTRFED